MYNLPPLGLINLATTLKDSPHDVSLIDFVLAIRQSKLSLGDHIYGDCAERVLRKAPDLVGFSAQCTTYPAVIQIAKKIKIKRPDVKIVIGGHNASFVDRLTLEKVPAIDVVVRGEGERTFKELVSAYDAGRDEEGLLGITYRRGPNIIRNQDRELIADLDELPLPDYSFLPSPAEYREACRLPRSIAILEVGRGCPHHCIYCSESILWRRRSRTFSVSRLVAEMENLSRDDGAECFLLAYDQFTANRAFVEAFCRQVIEKGLNQLPWYCISRLDSVDPNLLALMREAGCESMCYGVDSGSKKTLTFIRKKIDHDILYQRVQETADQGIIPTLSYVVGFPGETRGDIDETLWLALRTGILGNNNPLIQMPTVLPGTDLFQQYQDRLLRSVDTYFALGLEFDGGRRLKSDDALIDSDSRLFSSFYNLPCPGRSLEELHLIADFFPLIVQFYPKTFLLLSLECQETVSELFLSWLNWLKDRLKRQELSLSPRDCFVHFKHFTWDLLGRRKSVDRKHLSDVLKYETAALEAGRLGSTRGNFSIDLNRVDDLRPRKDKDIIMSEFAFDIPVIILDLKAGRFSESYPSRRSLLVFKQRGNILNVSEINPFARDLLNHCDGEKTLKDIARGLHQNYGPGMTPDEFFEACHEAVRVLGEKRLLEVR
jgi:radical SAM superfamily enzyme YgiQ (UPF0313 family)